MRKPRSTSKRESKPRPEQFLYFMGVKTPMGYSAKGDAPAYYWREFVAPKEGPKDGGHKC